METSGNEPAQGEITGCSSPSWDRGLITTGNWKNTAFHVRWGLGDGLRGPLATAPVGTSLPHGNGWAPPPFLVHILLP